MFRDFQEFSLDFTNRQLMVQGTLVDIDDRAFVIFEQLINAYPNTCTKQQLLEAAWPDTVVSDWSLSKLISDTRKIFKTAGYNGPLLQTVHGKGYRLAVELAKQLEQTSEPTPSTSPTIANPLTRKTTVALLLVCSLLLLLLLATNIERETHTLITQEPVGANYRILWVDDNPINNEKERAHFESNKIAVYSVESTEEALRLLSLYQYQLVISDMGRHDDKLAGIHLLEKIRAMNNQTPFILYTWHSTPELVEEIKSLGGQAVAVESLSLYDYVDTFIVEGDKSQ